MSLAGQQASCSVVVVTVPVPQQGDRRLPAEDG